MKISDLAKRTGCSVETIRFYEQQGLLSAPTRTSGNYRTYAGEHVDRLKFIRHCRYLDMALEEIRRLLASWDSPQQSCHAVNALLDEHIRHVGERMGELRALEKDLKALRQSCLAERTAKDCGILQELATANPNSVKPREPTHIRGTHSHKQ